MDLSTLARPWIEIGARLHAAGIFAGTQGSVSQRFPDGTRTADGELVHPGAWLVSAHGAQKGRLRAEDFCLLAPGGSSLAGPVPALEWRMHGAIYRIRDDVHAVIHAHPHGATALALAGIELPVESLAELAVEFGQIPLIPYATPGTEVVAEAIETYLGQGNAALLDQHGAFALGVTPEQAAVRIERLERAAQIYITARLLLGGPPRTLGGTQIAAALNAAGKPTD